MKYNPFFGCGKYKTCGRVGPEVIPPRFVYHLDYNGGMYNNSEYAKYKRLNISREGLFGVDMGNGGVWANVYQSNPYRWFPITLDLWDCTDEFSSVQLVSKYDVWQIDTKKIKNKWHIDPNMQQGEVVDLKKVLYTQNTVPGKALKLFHMELDKDILYNCGVYRLAPMKPVEQINMYIRHTHRRKRIYFNK